MCVVAEALDEALGVLVDQGMGRDVVLPHHEVRAGGQLALDDQVGGLEEGALLGELLDRVAAVPEDAAPAVDVADPALAGGGVGERGVIAHQAERREVGRADRTVLDGQVTSPAGPVVDDGQGVGHAAPRGIASIMLAFDP